jgi:hypothetical protein
MKVLLKCGSWKTKPRLALDRVQWQMICTSAVKNTGFVSGGTSDLRVCRYRQTNFVIDEIQLQKALVASIIHFQWDEGRRSID